MRLEEWPGPARHFIAGQFADPLNGAWFEHVSPATGSSTNVARGDLDDVAAAAAVASSAFVEGYWSRAKPATRRRVLIRVADLIEERSEEIVAAQTLEMGSPIGPKVLGPHPIAERAAWNFRFFAQEQEMLGNEAFNRDDNLLTYTMSDPAGTFALITPWNAPFQLSAWKIAPCLAYGNSCIHKPSELSPLSALLLCEILDEAGLPAGVYNLIQGIGKEVGPALVEHPTVAGVSFTGSPGTALDIASRCAPQMKRTSFELGGKSATIVFADADLDSAVSAAARSIFFNSGQVCVAGSRILVEHSIMDLFIEGLTAEAAKWLVGDPFDRATRIGPLVSRSQYERVANYLEVAGREGRVLFGGVRPSAGEADWYVDPAVVFDVESSARVCQEEIFGPVAVVMPFESRDHAIRLANDSTYGLADYIWTESLSNAHYVAQRLEVGMIWINSGVERDLRQPFGGMKRSGMGREGGDRSRNFYTDTRFTSFPLTPRKYGRGEGEFS